MEIYKVFQWAGVVSFFLFFFSFFFLWAKKKAWWKPSESIKELEGADLKIYVVAAASFLLSIILVVTGMILEIMMI